jgi:hypothetical protein
MGGWTRVVRLVVAILRTPWPYAFIAALSVTVFQPFPGDLDRGTILAIAGLDLVVVAAAFGLLALLAQHLAESYSRRMLSSLLTTLNWQWTLGAQGVGVVYVVALALWRPAISTGVAATVLLSIGLIESWRLLRQLLDRFDPVELVRAQTNEGLRRLSLAPAPQLTDVAVADCESILQVLVAAGDRADTTVVRECFQGWNRVLQEYVARADLFFNDGLLYWLFARCQEMVEKYARESAALVLPVVVEGVTLLGTTTARHRNRLNPAVDEGTYHAVRVLKVAVLLAANASLSTAADQAMIGIGAIAEACLDSAKLETLQEPIAALIQVGRSSAKVSTTVASRAAINLARILLRLAHLNQPDVMIDANAETASDGLCAIVREAKGHLTPGHFLVAPLTEDNLARVVFELAQAAGRSGKSRWTAFDRAARQIADLGLELATRPLDGDVVTVPSNAVESVAALLVAVMSIQSRDPWPKIISELVPAYVKLGLEDEQGRLHVERGLGSVLLALYYGSKATLEVEGLYRKLIADAAEAITGAGRHQRRRLSVALRLVGAAAMHYADVETAQSAAAAVLPRRPNTSKAIGLTDDLFESDYFASQLGVNPIARRGLPDPAFPNYHLDEKSRRDYLELETRMKQTVAAEGIAEPRPDYVFTFGYGSNMCLGRLCCRVPSAEKVAVAVLRRYKFAFNKRSASAGGESASGKANAFETDASADRVLGVVFEVREDEMLWLDEAEGRDQGYLREELTVTEVGGNRSFKALTYVAEEGYIDDNLQPFSWYKRHVVEGAKHFGLDAAYVAEIEAFQPKEDQSRSRTSKELQFPCDRKLTDAERVELDCHRSAAATTGPPSRS